MSFSGHNRIVSDDWQSNPAQHSYSDVTPGVEMNNLTSSVNAPKYASSSKSHYNSSSSSTSSRSWKFFAIIFLCLVLLAVGIIAALHFSSTVKISGLPDASSSSSSNSAAGPGAVTQPPSQNPNDPPLLGPAPVVATASCGDEICSAGELTSVCNYDCLRTCSPSGRPPVPGHKGCCTGLVVDSTGLCSDPTPYTCEAVNGGKCHYVAANGYWSHSNQFDCSAWQSLVSNCVASNGTYTNPWGSILQAQACAQPGDFVIVRGGVYSYSCKTYPNQAEYSFYSIKDGTPNRRITWKSYPGEKVVLRYGLLFNAPHSNGGRGGYITADGFILIQTAVNINSKNVTLKNLDISEVNNDCGSNNAGIYINNYAADILIENCKSYRSFWRGPTGLNTDYRLVPSYFGFATNCACLKIMHHVANLTVRDSEFYECPAGVHAKYVGECENMVFDRVKIHHTLTGFFGSSDSWSIENSLFYQNGGDVHVGGCNGVCGGNDVTIRRSTFVGGGIALKTGHGVISDNVLYRNRTGDSGWMLSWEDGVYGYGWPNFNLTGFDSDRNCFYSLTPGKIYHYGHEGQPNFYYTLNEVSTTFPGMEKNSVFAKPLFVNESNYQYTQLPSSPCIAYGMP